MFDELKQRMQRLERTAVYRTHVFTFQLAMLLGMNHELRLLPTYRTEATNWQRKTLANTIRRSR